MTTDVPPEVEYRRRNAIYTANGEEVPEIEEDEEEPEHLNNSHHLITHHNTHQESKRIRRYSAKLQNLDNQQYYEQVDRTPELQYSSRAAPYDPPEQRSIPTTTLKSTKELHQLFGKG